MFLDSQKNSLTCVEIRLNCVLNSYNNDLMKSTCRCICLKKCFNVKPKFCDSFDADSAGSSFGVLLTFEVSAEISDVSAVDKVSGFFAPKMEKEPV
jgi:hypothetical protein